MRGVGLYTCLFADLVREGEKAIASRVGFGRRVTSVARGVERERGRVGEAVRRARQGAWPSRGRARERERDGEEDGEVNEVASSRERESEKSFERAHKLLSRERDVIM